MLLNLRKWVIDIYRWPWALIEGALQLQGGLDNPPAWEDRQIAILLKIFTGDDKAASKINPSRQEGESGNPIPM